LCEVRVCSNSASRTFRLARVVTVFGELLNEVPLTADVVFPFRHVTFRLHQMLHQKYAVHEWSSALVAIRGPSES